MVDYYFIYGPAFDTVIASYRNATGNAPMFPKWSFGLFQSQDRYKSQSEIISVKDKYRNNKGTTQTLTRLPRYAGANR